jgi:hypothetical protein
MALKAWFAKQTTVVQAAVVLAALVTAIVCADMLVRDDRPDDDGGPRTIPTALVAGGVTAQGTPARFTRASKRFVTAVEGCAALLRAGDADAGAGCVDDAFAGIERSTAGDAIDPRSAAVARRCRETVGRLDASARSLHGSLARMQALAPGDPALAQLDEDVRAERSRFGLLSDAVVVDCAVA